MSRPAVHPRVQVWLATRDRALARGDGGVVRSMDAELRRLGVPDDATLANPSGRPLEAVAAVGIDESASPGRPGRPKLPRCEHNNITDRCTICDPELLAK